GVERDDRDEGSAGECRRRSSWHHQPEKMQQRAVDSGMQQRQQKQPPNVVYALHITLPAEARSHWSVEQAYLLSINLLSSECGPLSLSGIDAVGQRIDLWPRLPSADFGDEYGPHNR